MLGMMSAAVLAMTFSSCNKEEEQVPLEPGTAVVNGRLTANLDASVIEPQAIPAGTGVTFVIDGRDLDPNPDFSYTYDKVIERVEVDADGNYSVTLPARKNPINVQVIFDDFEFDATVVTTDDAGFQTTTVSRKVFSRSNTTISVVEGQSQVRDFFYGMDGDDFVNRATIRGTITAQFIDNVGDVTGISEEGWNQEITGTGNDTLLTEGSGYEDGTDIPVTGGSGEGMTVDITAETIGIVQEVTLLSGGENYWVSNYNTTTTGDGTGLVINVDAVDGANNNAVEEVSVGWNAGEGYAVGDVVTITGGDGNATVQINEITEGKVTSVTLNNPGENYTIGDVVTISEGTGATFTITNVAPYNDVDPVPANVVLSFRTNSGNGEIYKTTTNADGEYLIQIPVTPNSGSDQIQMRGATFEAETTYLEDEEYVQGDKIYSLSEQWIPVNNDDIKEIDRIYTRQN